MESIKFGKEKDLREKEVIQARDQRLKILERVQQRTSKEEFTGYFNK